MPATKESMCALMFPIGSSEYLACVQSRSSETKISFGLLKPLLIKKYGSANNIPYFQVSFNINDTSNFAFTIGLFSQLTDYKFIAGQLSNESSFAFSCSKTPGINAIRFGSANVPTLNPSIIAKSTLQFNSFDAFFNYISNLYGGNL